MNSYSFMSTKEEGSKVKLFHFFRSTPKRALICGCKLGPEKIPVHNTCFHYLSSFRCALATISVHYWLLASPSEIMDSQCNERISTKQSVSATASQQAKNRNKLNGSQCRINGWKTRWKLRFHGLCWIITKWCTNDPKWTNYIVQKEEGRINNQTKTKCFSQTRELIYDFKRPCILSFLATSSRHPEAGNKSIPRHGNGA